MTNQFVFRKHDTVGSAAAEHDSQFLDDCFVDTGDINFLLDLKNPKRVIVGRTGAGKTALLHRIVQTDSHVIQLSPHNLSLNFIATNKVITFFEEAGVNLSPFYVLLWKHLLVVELIKERFQIRAITHYLTGGLIHGLMPPHSQEASCKPPDRNKCRFTK